MKPYPHQKNYAEFIYLNILRKYGIAYIAWEERTGKTVTSLLIAEMSKAEKILIITKKKALEGWKEPLEKLELKKKYTLINYHQVHKIKDSFDLIILDESHAYLSSYPKVGKIWKDVYHFTKDKPIIYLSATPFAQGYQQLYHQFRLTKYSPYKKWNTFYKFHRKFGKQNLIRVAGRLQETYSVFDQVIYQMVKHLFHTLTRAELGFEHEPEDIIHWVELDKTTKKIYNTLIEDEIIETYNSELEEIQIVCDSSMKLRTSLYQIEGGTIKIDDEYHLLPNLEKIKSILKDFGDTEDLGIMYEFKAEKLKLEAYFKKATLYQSTSFAEGVDLSHLKHLVVYSQNFSTSKYSQRRARQANKIRKEPIKVHFYLVKGAISEQVYNTVAKNKVNFIDSLFERKKL